MANKKGKVEMRQEKNKELILDQLRKTPVVEISCSKLGIGRTTYYRMREQDPEFAKKADEALSDGMKFVCDVAESQLLNSIREGNLTAIIFWLKNRHPAYRQQLFQSGITLAQDEDNNLFFELFGKLKPETEKLLEPKININPDEHGTKSQSN